ncbi:MAG: sulfate transporter [Rhodospirillales bacterium]|nr:sulfate transporter [Rhodospirillales bacterium]
MDPSPSSPPEQPTARAAAAPIRFDRFEWAGAFGDLGTLVPFVAAYVTLMGIDPYGILFTIGAALIACGLVYRTPFPVQPMKAIGAVATTQAAQTIVIAPGAVYASGLITGAIWLVLGWTGAARRIAGWVARPVAMGIILGLGFAFMLQGTQMMAANWIMGGVALAGTLLLLANPVVPAMLLLLFFGIAAAVIQDPSLIQELGAIEAGLRWPSWSLAQVTWNDVLVGFVFLALPQLPLTMGNAVLAITEENNRLFPGRPVSEKRVAISTGIMNLLAPLAGGVPLCHGAGGLAGHVRFGARTGGAPIILGASLVVLATFFASSLETLFRMFPAPVLGVILFLAGAQLARGAWDDNATANDRMVVLATAALAVWNVGIAFVFGAAVHALMTRKLLKW